MIAFFQRLYDTVRSWFIKEDDSLAKLVLLHKCIEEGELLLVESLLDAGADVNRRTEDDLTALMRAAFYGHKDIVELLLGRGVIDVQENDGFSALSIASMQGYKEIVRVLLAHGAQVGIHGYNGSMALEVALYLDEKRCLHCFLEAEHPSICKIRLLGRQF